MATAHPDILDAAILTLVLARHPSPVHRDELARAFAGDDWPPSVSTLVIDGLLHVEGDLHLASRAAARFDDLVI